MMIVILVLSLAALIGVYAWIERETVLFGWMFVRRWLEWMAGRIREYMGGAGR